MLVCPSCGQENPEIAKFCLACGAALAPPEPAAEERKLITVLFCDIVGSTATAEQLDPEDVRARLAPYYERARRELERHGGTVEKFIGDAVVALFGAPVAHEDDPERAVRAALAVREAIEHLNAQDSWLDLKIRVGVNTGEALVVLGARASEGEGMASGDVMNTAARLQSAAPVNGIVVGELTYRATRGAIEYSDAEPIAAKGKAEPVRVWQAVAVRQEPGIRQASRGPFVGREAELSELLELWQWVRTERVPALATVVGSPGVGKSRLIAELMERVRAEGAVYAGRCLPYGEGITYWPITEILKAAAGSMQTDDAVAMSAKLEELLQSLDTDDQDELRTMAAAAANLLGIATTPQGTYSAAVIAQAELHWGFRRIVQLLAQREPLLVVFEDLHWAEATLVELIQFLLVEAADTPVLIVVSSRPEFADAEPSFVAADRRRRLIGLEPLAADEAARLLGALVGGDGPESEHTQALLRNAGGNPLFLEETVQMLADLGPQPTGEGQLPVPTSLQALIAARLDQLPTSQKRVTQHASIVGHVFWPGAVEHVQGESAGNGSLSSDLEALERRDLVHEHPESSLAGEREYAFKHILIRDVAYGQVPKGRRVGMHVRFADWIDALPGAAEEFVEIVAWHLEQACELAGEVARTSDPAPVERAVATLRAAGEKAERREGYREADRFYVRALALLGDEGAPAAVDIRLRRARTMTVMGELERGLREFEAVADLARELGRLDVRGEALAALANTDLSQGRASAARRRLSELHDLAEQLNAPRLSIKAVYRTATLEADFGGAFPEAVAQLRQGIRRAVEIDDLELRIEGHLRLGFLLYNSGSFAAAEEELHLCSKLAGELGSHTDEARAAFQLGLVKYYRGDRAEARRLGLQVREWLERTSDTYFQIQNYIALALYELADDAPAEAERWLREAMPAAVEFGGWLVIEVYRYLIEVLVRQDRVEEAEDLAEFAGRNLPEEDLLVQADVRLSRALVAGARGDVDGMTRLFRESVTLLDEQELPITANEARMTFADWLRKFGAEEEARKQLEEARAAFARMGAEGLVEEIEAQLNELSGAREPGPTPSR